MKYFSVAVVATMVGLASSFALAQETIDYKTAYKNALAGDKPLLVLVTADWCPPCQAMKKTTLPVLNEKNAFKDFHFSTIDLDADEKVGKELIGNRGVPQLIMFEKQGNQWVRRYVAGFQSVEKVEAFLAQAKKIRLAQNSDQLSNK